MYNEALSNFNCRPTSRSTLIQLISQTFFLLPPLSRSHFLRTSVYVCSKKMNASSGPADIQIQINWNHYLDLAGFVILIYDCILTFDREVQLFWSWHKTGFGSMLFYVNRYLTLLGMIPYFYLSGGPRKSIDDDAVAIYLEALIFAIQIVTSVLFILRLYALYGGNIRIAIFLTAVLLGVIINAFVQLFKENQDSSENELPPAVANQVGSLQPYSIPDVKGVTERFHFRALHMVYIWIGIFIFDICVFALTVYKTLKMWRENSRGGIGMIIMRDGLMYFVVIALINLANIFVFAFGQEFTRDLIPVLATILGSSMMSRMLLNMREGQLIDRRSRAGLADMGGGFEAESSASTSAMAGLNYPTTFEELEVELHDINIGMAV
ncbi:hypothetical protein D9757_009446 [Collybiopsis confluens]|uniref:DUF6533 domain-containing protein n=1 Tax=Collybiopsis confluens TaxID=2823264 RepID=A0A8H5HD89_9AGAR|nr:hypothetical protein D9757_009446 [Collybiopsis confluens]